MLDHQHHVELARSATEYLTRRTDAELTQPVSNCPGWTVYNAAVHIARSCASWEQMIAGDPNDPGARDRAAATRENLPNGVNLEVLGSWCQTMLDTIGGDEARPCYFPLTGGPGTIGLWAWHAASELGVHRLDVESALGHDHTITDVEAVDAAIYVAEIVSPAMRLAAGQDPGGLVIELIGADGAELARAEVNSETDRRATVRGPALQVLLGLWGRPNRDTHTVDGDAEIWNHWQHLPSTAFQFGTWN